MVGPAFDRRDHRDVVDGEAQIGETVAFDAAVKKLRPSLAPKKLIVSPRQETALHGPVVDLLEALDPTRAGGETEVGPAVPVGVAPGAVSGPLGRHDHAQVRAVGREHMHAARAGREHVALHVDLEPVRPSPAHAGNGNSGVAQIIKSTPGAIGYVDFATAKADIAAHRVPWISFKLPYSWPDMVAGKGDAGAVEHLGVGLAQEIVGMDVLVVPLLPVPAADRRAISRSRVITASSTAARNPSSPAEKRSSSRRP